MEHYPERKRDKRLTRISKQDIDLNFESSFHGSWYKSLNFENSGYYRLLVHSGMLNVYTHFSFLSISKCIPFLVSADPCNATEAFPVSLLFLILLFAVKWDYGRDRPGELAMHICRVGSLWVNLALFPHQPTNIVYFRPLIHIIYLMPSNSLSNQRVTFFLQKNQRGYIDRITR